MLKDLSKRPDVIDSNPSIDNFINNFIDTNYGVQVPAVVQALIETFSRDVGKDQLDSPEMWKYISQCIHGKGPRTGFNAGETNLGKGVGTQMEELMPNDNNRDPFVLMTPLRG